MAMNLVRTGTSAAVGVGSGLAQSQFKQPVDLFGQKVSGAALFEAAVVVAGALAQYMSPFTMPDVVDGAVDGGIALLAKRGTERVMAGTLSGSRLGAWGMAGGYTAPRVGGCGGSRGAIGNVDPSGERQLY